MILYAAYVKGSLLDQVAAETEDTALALLKMDYPDIKGLTHEEVKFEIIDGNHQPTREQEEAVAAVVEKVTAPSSAKPAGQVVVIEASEINIQLNVVEGVISEVDVQKLQIAVEEGTVIARKKG